MTKEGFKELQQSAAASGKPMTHFLRERGIAYSTYNYWRKRYEREMASPMMAPITVMRTEPFGQGIVCGGENQCLPGVTLAFPNGLRAHFGRGSERVLMEVLNRSLPGHVLPQ